MADQDKTLDILHPSTCLEWEEWPSLPVKMSRTRSVYLNGTLYVGGETIDKPGYRAEASLYSFKPGVDSTWTVTDTPTFFYTLVTHDSELLLVGGRKYLTEVITNKVFTMRDGQFVEVLPPMNERRESPSAVSSGSALVVAGGSDASGGLSSVEVFKDGQWTTAPSSLPSAECDIKSALHGDQWYLITSFGKVFRTSLQSLISGSDQSPWETLPDAPNYCSAAAFFGSRLLSIGGGGYGYPTIAIYAFSSSTQSWVHVADMPLLLGLPTAVVLSSEQLILSSGAKVFHGKLIVTPFDADSHFTMGAINCLKASAGISLVEELVEHTPTAFPAVADMDVREMYDLILKEWASGHPPTWTELFRVLKEMGLSELAGRIEKYLRGSVPEDPPRSPPDEEGDSEEEKDDEIPEQNILKLNNVLADANTLLTKENIQLKKTNNNLQQEIARLKSEAVKEEQLDPETIKEEPTPGNDYQSPSSTRMHIKEETKAEPQTTGALQKEIIQLKKANTNLEQEIASLKVKEEQLDPVSIKEEPTSRNDNQLPSSTPMHIKEETKAEPQTTNLKSEEPVSQLLPLGLSTLQHHAIPFNLPGVEVVASTCVIVTNSPQTFHWVGYGFKLTIPQGSLPAGVDQCRLDIKASVAGQYQFPGNLQLVSGVFWVRLHPSGQFQQQLTVEIQHCAKMTSSTKLSFVKAHCSQESLPYTFKQLEGRGSFTEFSSYGSLELNQFSGLAVTGEDVERVYTASLYYLGSELRSRDIHFVVNWDNEIHNTFVSEKYSSKRAVLGVNHFVEFEKDRVTLDIPMAGAEVKGGWKITPMFPPTVFKKHVDQFKPGQRIPYCHLNAEMTKKNKNSVPKLFHQVKLVGAKDPYNIITINLDPQRIVPVTMFGDLVASKPAVSCPGNGIAVNEDDKGDKNQLGTNDLQDVFSQLVEAAKDWFNLGLALRIKVDTLEGIKSNENCDRDRLREMLTHWLRSSPSRTWSNICNGLRSDTVKQSNLADKIKKRSYGHQDQLYALQSQGIVLSASEHSSRPRPLTGEKREATEYTEQGPPKRVKQRKRRKPKGQH